jgi:predicted unusual protein kinase regulating ubiquinone biosynthesis (AarF/ABC1/UbiB family)
MSDEKSRTRLIGEIAVMASLKELEALAWRLLQSKEKRVETVRQKQTEIADLIFKNLAYLKGTGLKILQTLALDENLLPEPYIKKFENAYKNVPHLSLPIAKKTLKTELRRPIEEVFSQFEYDNPASASLGQVHRARLFDGTEVAVKIQYPTIAENISSDMDLLMRMASVLNQPLIKNTILEIAEQTKKEIDYGNELKNLSFFSGLSLRASVKVPKPILEFSGSKLLVMSYLPGQALSDLLKTGEVDELGPALQTIFDFFFEVLFSEYRVYCDPHPGNFLVDTNGAVSVVDFGAIKGPLSEDVICLFWSLLKKEEEKIQILRLYKELGARINDDDAFYARVVIPFRELLGEVFNQPSCQVFKKKKHITDLRKVLFAQSTNPELADFSPEFTMIHKATQSLLLLIAKFPVTIDTRIKKY